MSLAELTFLNGLIQSRDTSVLIRYGINKRFFQEQKCAFVYVMNHIKEYGELPQTSSVVLNCKDFEELEVFESLETSAIKLIETQMKKEQRMLLQELAENFNTLDAHQILNRLQKKSEELAEMSFLKGKSGVNWATNGEERYEEYQSRKQRDFSRRIPLLFDELTEAVGEMESGSVNILMASTSTGKSWCGALQALIGWKNGYRTLYESGEMGKDEVMFRLDSLFSAMTFHQGFNNKGLWRGDLENEEEYKRFTDQFHKNNGKQDFIIKTPSDWKKGLTLEQIEYDVRQTGADLVVIDQWSLIKSNGNSHEARAALSVDLKSLAAKLGIIVFLLYQTDSAFLRDKPKKDEHKPDILTAPTLANFSQTIQVIQDASLILGWNSTMFKGEDGKYVGKAIINVLKARNGGSEELNLSFLPNLGIIRPIVATDLF